MIPLANNERMRITGRLSYYLSMIEERERRWKRADRKGLANPISWSCDDDGWMAMGVYALTSKGMPLARCWLSSLCTWYFAFWYSFGLQRMYLVSVSYSLRSLRSRLQEDTHNCQMYHTLLYGTLSRYDTSLLFRYHA